jgi:glycosyltransferase involved in cell wall biosynthesis
LLVKNRPRLLFISPRYLLPADSGGKIRTGQILRGLKGGRFAVTLLSPAPKGAPERDAAQLAKLCDDFEAWPEPKRGPLFAYTRMRLLASRLPISVATDRTSAGQQRIAAALAGRPDLVVVDFTHAAVLIETPLAIPSLLFTHNVEAEIFRRHLELASNPLFRAIWRDQYRKMRRFEQEAVRRFDTVVAVSDRDGARLREEYGVKCEVIPTGVDTESLPFDPPNASDDVDPAIVFTASMDSYANIDGVSWLMDAVWPLIVAGQPNARAIIVGREPNPKLVRIAKERRLPWTFTGYVAEIAPHVHEAAVYVVPLRVGSGTRIKIFEALALGRPVVSTAIGVEGLELAPGKHYLLADTAEAFAASVLRLLKDKTLRTNMALEARRLVDDNYSFRKAARTFEDICVRTLARSASLTAASERVG